MSKHIVSCLSAYAVLFLCIAFQCLITSDARISAVNISRFRRLSAENKGEITAKNLTTKAKAQEHTSTTIAILTSTLNTTGTSHVKEHPAGIDSKLNPGAVLRGFYVFVGLGAIVVIYIVVRTIRLRRKKTTVRKYGILASREDVEMTPLGAEDEEEDTTLFDVNNHSRP